MGIDQYEHGGGGGGMFLKKTTLGHVKEVSTQDSLLYDEFSFPFLNLVNSLRIQLQQKSHTFDKLSGSKQTRAR